MDAKHLQDRLYWGLNRAANVLGHITDAYRPRDSSDPLDPTNRYLRLHAAFSGPGGDFNQAVGFGGATWRGFFDASYTRTGDYLVQGHDIWFVATQQSLLPVVCVKTNRIVSITRANSPTTGTSYGSSPVVPVTEIIARWPASVLGTSSSERSQVHLPNDTTVPSWITLLPASHGKLLQSLDIITDENDTTGVVVAAELSDLGWRLNVRQVTT